MLTSSHYVYFYLQPDLTLHSLHYPIINIVLLALNCLACLASLAHLSVPIFDYVFLSLRASPSTTYPSASRKSTTMAGAYPYGVQLASSGMNISTLPAASIWADTCAIDARQFRGLANQTLPFQIDDPLADVLHDVGLGSSNGSQIVVDIKAFMKSLGDRPFYSRSMLRHAADQLSRARNGLKITLMDCYGAKRVYPARDLSLPRYVQFVLYLQERLRISYRFILYSSRAVTQITIYVFKVHSFPWFRY